jgi:hypothetical protein
MPRVIGVSAMQLIRNIAPGIITLAAIISSAAAAIGAEISTGSGVVIGTKGEILTNSHVVEACQTITVKLASGSSQLSTLVARDEKNDLAVIRPAGTDNSAASIAMFREGLPVRAGDAIVALGYPLSGVLATEANVSVGNVSALAGVADDSRYLQISAPVQPGNSGGPLLDASGHLVGIVTAKLNALRVARFTGDIPENVNFALKAEVARTFLDSKGIKYQMERSDKQLSPADVGDIGRPFTVRIECERAGARSVTALGSPSPSEVERADQLCGDGNSLSKKTLDAHIEACSIVIGGNSHGPKVIEALLSRGNLYGTKHEYAKAYQDFKTVALSSDASDKEVAAAADLLGTMALRGEFGYAMDAMTWFHVAANKGDSVAMANIARLWAQGFGVREKNCDFARQWLQKAIAAGFDDAMGLLQSGYDGQCQW